MRRAKKKLDQYSKDLEEKTEEGKRKKVQRATTPQSQSFEKSNR